METIATIIANFFVWSFDIYFKLLELLPDEAMQFISEKSGEILPVIAPVWNPFWEFINEYTTVYFPF